MIEDKIKYNDYWERVQEKDKEIERLKEELEFEKASNKELISTGADLENKLIEEHKQTKTQLEMHIAFNKQLLGEIEKLDNENKRLNNIINRTAKYVQSLSSKGRGCDIYEDIKQGILKELKGVDKK